MIQVPTKLTFTEFLEQHPADGHYELIDVAIVHQIAAASLPRVRKQH